MALTVPEFDVLTIAFTAFGAICSYAKLAKARVSTYVVTPLVELIFTKGSQSPWRTRVEFFMFVAFGIVVGIVMTQPGNAMQAITAGMGWTAIVGKLSK